jgi:filamentous hemagglutinin family protein
MKTGTIVNSSRCNGPAVALAVAFVCMLSGNASANPSGADVVAGQVSMVSTPNQLLITNSPGAIINWRDFSILPGELTRFIQQSSSSSVLNRVTGQDPTKILGALQSNGKVFLINPNGIVFGAGARVDVNGLVASTLDINNNDFLAGKLKFSAAGHAGDVSNQGAITTPGGGQVYLIGSSVTNGGVITSPGGDVVLAAGQSVDLADSNDPDVRVVISAPGSQALNVGQVVVESGRVGIYGALVNQMGLVSANSAIAGANGKIVFKSSGDTLLGAGSVTTATGTGSGGTVEVTGERVGLTGDAVVDVSGEKGGGTVLIGGDEHGANARIQNASQAYLGAATQVKADAVQAGDGGKVVVWSDQQTQMYGRVSARGAGENNGGFAEISSKGYLDFRGLADLRAPSGKAGTLLLDPSDITIGSSPSTGDVAISASAPFAITAANATSTLSTTDLQNQLALGNVTVSTASAASAPAGGTITVASSLAWSNSNTLRLEAEQGIALNAPITASAGTLSLETTNGDITQSGGPITAAALAAVASNGSVGLNDAGNTIGVIAGRANGALGFALVNSGSFTVGTVPGGGQASDVSGVVSTNALNSGVVLQAPNAGDITIAAPVDAGSAGIVVGGAGAVIQGTGGLISGRDLTVISDGSVGIGSSSAPLRTAVGTLRNATAMGDVYIRNTGPLTVNFVEANGVASISASGSMTTPIPAACDCTPGISGLSVVLASEGSMLVNAGGTVTGETDVALHAGYQLASDTYTSATTLAVDGDVFGSRVGLFAGGAITTSGTLHGVVTQTPSLYSAPSLPPLTECTASPMTPGCSAALPTLSACTANPSIAGCSAVLPTLSACTASPTTAGCSVVLPSLAACSVDPSAAGCSAVLPTLSACTASPATAGCSVVLPTLAACSVDPSAAGCSAVLPTLSTCTASPTTAGCIVVLPSLAACTVNPTAAGCSAVLPTLSACTASPTIAGCGAVLPTLASCTANPAAAGCSVVLPTLAQCAMTPSIAGCEAVLPQPDFCGVHPADPQCALPSTPISQSNPVAKAVNQTVNLVNASTNTVASSGGTSSPAGVGTDPQSSSSDNKPDSKIKSDNLASSDKQASKNDTAKKMYCN